MSFFREMALKLMLPTAAVSANIFAPQYCEQDTTLAICFLATIIFIIGLMENTLGAYKIIPLGEKKVGSKGARARRHCRIAKNLIGLRYSLGLIGLNGYYAQKDRQNVNSSTCHRPYYATCALGN